MKKARRAAVSAAIVLICAAAGFSAGSYAERQRTQKAAQAAEESREMQQGPQAGYILIHTTDGEAWGFYGDMKILSDGEDGRDIDIDMTGWIVGSTHDCYNQDTEE